MGRGAILPPVSIVALPPAAPAGTPQRNTEIIAIPPAHGASTVIRSTGVQKPAPAVARRTMTMPITTIPMGVGQGLMIRSTNARKPAPLAEIPARNTQTTPTQTATANVTIAARLSP